MSKERNNRLKYTFQAIYASLESIVKLTVVAFLKRFFRHEPVHNRFDVVCSWMTNAQIDRFFGDVLIRHPGALKHIQYFTHITIGQFNQCLLTVLGRFQTVDEREKLLNDRIPFKMGKQISIYELFLFDNILQTR